MHRRLSSIFVLLLAVLLISACGAPHVCAKDRTWEGDLKGVPGEMGHGCYTHVSGSVRVLGLEYQDHVDSLETIRVIEGSLIVEANPWLLSLDGLAAIERVGGQVRIADNGQRLEPLPGLGLRALREVGGDLTVSQPDIDLQDLGSLREVGGTVRLDQVASLEGLGQVRTPTLEIQGLARDTDLRHAAGVHGLSTLVLLDNSVLRSLDGLQVPEAMDSVRIENNARLEDVSALLPLREVSGDVLIARNASLHQVEGLSNLRSTGSLSVRGLRSMRDLQGLRSLEQVDTHVQLASLDGLRDLSGLESLRTVGTALYIGDNPDLQQISNLHALEYVGDELTIMGNPALEVVSLPGPVQTEPTADLGFIELPALTQLELELDGPIAELRIRQTGLTHLDQIDGVTEIARDLSISRNLELVEISGFQDLHAAGGLTLQYLPVMAELSLADLREVGTLVVDDHPFLRSLDLPALQSVRQGRITRTGLQALTLPALTQVGPRTLEISDSLELTDLQLPAAQQLEGSLRLESLGLRDLRGLSGLREVGSLALVDLPELRTLDGLAGLQRASQGVTLTGLARVPHVDALAGAHISGTLVVRDLPLLPGLPELDTTALTDGLVLSDLDSLVDLQGLERLSSIGRALQLQDLPRITSLRGLGGVRSTVSTLMIERNDALVDLSDLHRLGGVDQSLRILHNPSLPQSEIDALLEHLDHSDASRTILGNGP